MPCDTITTTEVYFGDNTDPKLIHAALKEMGLRPVENGSYINFSTGNYNTKTHAFEFRGTLGEQHSEEIKRAYSAEVVKAQARRFGWKLKQGKEKYQYAITKRSI